MFSCSINLGSRGAKRPQPKPKPNRKKTLPWTILFEISPGLEGVLRSPYRTSTQHGRQPSNSFLIWLMWVNSICGECWPIFFRNPPKKASEKNQVHTHREQSCSLGSAKQRPGTMCPLGVVSNEVQAAWPGDPHPTRKPAASKRDCLNRLSSFQTYLLSWHPDLIPCPLQWAWPILPAPNTLYPQIFYFLALGFAPKHSEFMDLLL